MTKHPALTFVKHFIFSIEGPIILAVLVAGLFLASKPARPFWAEMACDGYLFPKWIEQKDPKVRSGLNTPAEQREAYKKAAQHVGYDERTSKAVGQSAATLCKQRDAQ